MPSNAPEVVALKKGLVLLYCDVPEFHEGQQSHRPDLCNFFLWETPNEYTFFFTSKREKRGKKFLLGRRMCQDVKGLVISSQAENEKGLH